MLNKIENIDTYIDVMNQIEVFIQKATKQGGIDTLTQTEEEELHQLSLLAAAYEDSIPVFPIRQPQTIADMIKIKMMQLNVKQKEMAKILGITESKLSEVLAGKRKVNMDLAKKLHLNLKIEASFILQTA
jgi:HTH-type transcriptional regulator / antitoxin HigA